MVSLLFCFTSRLVLRPQINTKCFYLCLLFARLLLLVPPPFLPLGLPPLHRFLFFFFVSSSAPSSFLFIKQLLSIFAHSLPTTTSSASLYPVVSSHLVYFTFFHPFFLLLLLLALFPYLHLPHPLPFSPPIIYSPDSYTLLYITSSSSPTSYIFTFSSSFSPIFFTLLFIFFLSCFLPVFPVFLPLPVQFPLLSLPNFFSFNFVPLFLISLFISFVFPPLLSCLPLLLVLPLLFLLLSPHPLPLLSPFPSSSAAIISTHHPHLVPLLHPFFLLLLPVLVYCYFLHLCFPFLHLPLLTFFCLLLLS